MLGGPYPGGRWIDELAVQYGDTEHDSSELPSLHAARLLDQPYNFSFSGIKGQLHQHIEQGRLDVTHVTQKILVAHVFQEEVTEVLTEKLAKAVQAFGAKTVGVV